MTESNTYHKIFVPLIDIYRRGEAEAFRQLSEREADEQLGIAKGLLEQADMIEQDIERVQQQMIADANSKREEAYARAPELKPKPKPGRPKKTAIK